MTRFLLIAAVIVCLSPFASLAAPAVDPQVSQPDWADITWAHIAVSPNPQNREAAISKLREAGPAGLQALLTVHASTVQRMKPAPVINGFVFTTVPTALLGEATAEASPTVDETLLKQAINQVAAQRDADISRLYWYTDLEAAKKVAEETGRPILSLRLLGQLTDEYSCANSRFFRTTLYANTKVSQVMRDQFVLHWSSERPVPMVTINFGDGRVLKRTLTGNSCHYVLDAKGRPVEAIPGLYGPAAFLRELKGAKNLVAETASLSDSDRSKMLARYHAQRHQTTLANWRKDLAAVRDDLVVDVSKLSEPELAALSTDEVWGKIGKRHAQDAALDGGTVAVIRRENPRAGRAMRLAVSKSGVEDPILRMVAQLSNSIAEDSIRNQYLLHRQIHDWFAQRQNLDSLADMNKRVYAEVFLTPATDPWIGLRPDTYTGLQDDGVTLSPVAAAGPVPVTQ